MNYAKSYSRVVLASTGAGAAVSISTGGGTTVSRLHALHVTSDSTSTITVMSGAVALSGAMPVDAKRGQNWPFDGRLEAVLGTSAGAAMTLASTGSLFGWGVISKSTA